MLRICEYKILMRKIRAMAGNNPIYLYDNRFYLLSVVDTVGALDLDSFDGFPCVDCSTVQGGAMEAIRYLRDNEYLIQTGTHTYHLGTKSIYERELTRWDLLHAVIFSFLIPCLVAFVTALITLRLQP